MPGWFLPVVKFVLPHLGTIMSAAKPAFTKKKAMGPDEESGVVQQQIAELQSVASQNTTLIKELAEQLRLTVSALEQGAAEAEKRMKRSQAFAAAAMVVSVASIVCAILAFMR